MDVQDVVLRNALHASPTQHSINLGNAYASQVGQVTTVLITSRPQLSVILAVRPAQAQVPTIARIA